MRRSLPTLLLAASCAGAFAQSVSFNGSMGDKALLVIDGQTRMLAVGAAAQGVKLLGVNHDEARVEYGGRAVVLRQGSPVNLGGAATAGSGREIVLTAGMGGHFFANGSINGKAARFVVDTGATAVAIGQPDADRLGLDYRRSPPIPMGTANGVVPGYRVMLNSVRIGDVDTFNVQAVVVPAAMEYVLLGNTFLTRFSMNRDSDTLRLEKR
ncbi:MAG: retropepsin-like aspartic protease [Pseudomonadota bacterium]